MSGPQDQTSSPGQPGPPGPPDTVDTAETAETADNTAGTQGEAPWSKLAIELGPLLVFFAAYATFGIYVATAVFMVAVAAALVTGYVRDKRFAPVPAMTAVIVVVFGALTLYLQDDTFIKMKPTMINLLFAAVLGVGLVLRRPFLRMLFGPVFELSARGWFVLTARWIGFFIAMAVINEIVWRNFSTDFWVYFKVFGIIPLNFLFALAQFPLIQRHAPSGAGQ
jgi:intracellular septation protein